jgi:hypothetical protein
MTTYTDHRALADITLLGKLLLINPSRHGLDPVSHGWSFLRAELGESDQIPLSSDTPSNGCGTPRSVSLS